MNQSADIVVSGGAVASMNSQRTVYDPGYVAVRNNIIVGVGPQDECDFVADRIIPADRSAVMPGLVNCHTHLSNGVSRGLFDELPLSEWVDKAMWPTLRATTENFAYEGARVSLAENILGGVTTMVVGEFGRPSPQVLDGTLRAIAESGSRAVVARISVDSAVDSDPSQSTAVDARETIGEALAEVMRLRSTYGSSLVEVVPEALGVLRCTPEMISEFASFARSENTRMTMHVASSPDEARESRLRLGMGSIERLHEIGALGPHLLIAHCVLPSADEIIMLAESRTGVSHNPVSNLMYATGIAPLSEMLDAGVRVGLGTDGASTNNGQNLWETMKMAIFLQKSRLSATWGSAELALELATIGGARAIGMEDMIGSLEVGKRADLIVIDLDRPHLLPRNTWPSNLVYSQNSSAVRTVIIDGEVVVKGGELLNWHCADLADRANAAAAAMNSQTGLADMYRERTRWIWNPGR